MPLRSTPRGRPGRLPSTVHTRSPLERRHAGAVFTTLVFGLCVVAACSRGLLETTVGKDVGYALQAMALALVVVVLGTSGPVSTRTSTRNGILLYGYALAGILSAAYVSIFKGFVAAWVYVAVMLVLAVPMWFFSSHYFEGARKIPVPFWIGAAGLASVVAATAQQAGLLLDVLPGSDMASLGGLVRPSGLSGSFLHYPLFIALTFFVFAQLWSSRRRGVYGLLAAVFAVAVVVSFSRSGAMILILGTAAFAITSTGTSQRVRFLFAGIAAALAVPLFMRDSVYAERILSSVSLEGGGNADRVASWGRALELWADSPMVIGGYTGMYTNITRNFGEVSSGVVESGALQQLVSIGLVGTVLGYALMFATFAAVDDRHAWLRAGTLGAILETFVYQSVEVIPFMVAFLLMPLISMHIAGDDQSFWKGSLEQLPGRSSRNPPKASLIALPGGVPHADSGGPR